MKKGQIKPSLFQSVYPDYLIDTSAWFNIKNRKDKEKVWDHIIWLIEQKRLFICSQVRTEIQDSDDVYPRLKPYEDSLLAGDRDDVEFLMHVGKVTHAHQAMSHARSEKNRADPYVVALAEIQNYTVVADESISKRRNRKIPGVCSQRNIRCLSLKEFVAAVRKERNAETQKDKKRKAAITKSPVVPRGSVEPASG